MNGLFAVQCSLPWSFQIQPGSTHTIDAVAIAANQFSELATGAAVPKGRFSLEWDANSKGRIILAQNEGLILRNQILMGAAGTARVNVEMEWEELNA